MTYYATTHTPVGPILLVGTGEVLQGIYWQAYHSKPAIQAAWQEHTAPFAPVLDQLADYFAGRRTRLDIPYQIEGTPFQRRVWQELTKIEFGQTRSYLSLAQAIGLPEAVRAVGAAIGQNPLAIIVPCHRVIASDGKLTGFAGGLEAKRRLLEHEGALPRPPLTLL